MTPVPLTDLHILRVPTRVASSLSLGEKWCFVCRKRVMFTQEVHVPTDEMSYYGPHSTGEVRARAHGRGRVPWDVPGGVVTVPLTEQDIERMGREARIANATRWPEGDSWLRGYAEDVTALLADRAALQASLVSAQEALRSVEWVRGAAYWYCPACGGNKTYGHKPGCQVGAVLAGTAERQEAENPPPGMVWDDCAADATDNLRPYVPAGSAEPPAKPAVNTTAEMLREPPAKPEEETT